MLKRIFYLVLSLCFIMVSCENPVDTETVKVTVSYDTNGATSGVAVVDTTMYEEGAVLTVADNSGELAKTGYSFTGWSTTATGEAVNTVIIGTENITLYAAWTLLPTFTVTYDLDGATTGSISPATYDTGTTVTVPAQGELLKTGYTFSGWLIDTEETTSFDITEDVTLSVNWLAIPPAMTSEATIDIEGMIKVNVTMSNVDQPDGTAFIATGWCKGEDGTDYDWKGSSNEVPSYFGGTIDSGALNFTIYRKGSDTNIVFKIISSDGNWVTLVDDDTADIDLPITDFTYGDEIDVVIDCTDADIDPAADVTMTKIGSDVSIGVFRKVVFNINNLPDSFDGDVLALAGEGIFTSDLSNRSWWKDGINATVSSNTASFTYYTAEESTLFRIITSGSDPEVDRLQDSRSTANDQALVIDLTDFDTDTTVTIDWDSTTSWSIITED